MNMCYVGIILATPFLATHKPTPALPGGADDHALFNWDTVKELKLIFNTVREPYYLLYNLMMIA